MGSSQSRSTWPVRAVTVRLVGAPGAIGVHGVIGSDATEGRLEPISFAARTRKRCATPSASGETVTATEAQTQPTTPTLRSQVVHDVPSSTE